VTNKTYHRFLEELPSVLKDSTFSAKALETITLLAAMKNSVLLQGVKFYAPQIIGELEQNLNTCVLEVLLNYL
jgi:hypothetical protein